jgi:hypothetical protein
VSTVLSTVGGTIPDTPTYLAVMGVDRCGAPRGR